MKRALGYLFMAVTVPVFTVGYVAGFAGVLIQAGWVTGREGLSRLVDRLS